MRRPLSALSLGSVLLFASCGHRTSPTGSIHIDSTLESLIPSDVVFIMGADIDAIRNTPVYKQHIGIVNLPRLDEFTRRTGLDPRKDLDQVLSVTNGKTGLLMAKGKFNPKELADRLEKQGAKRFTYKGSDLYGDERNAVLIVDSTTALAGPTPALEAALDARAGPHHGMAADLAARVRTIPPNSQIWAAFVGGVQGLNVTVPQGSNLAMALQVLRGLDSAMLGMDLRNGLDLNADAQCKTDADAKRLHDALKGIIGLGRLSTPDNKPDLLKLYDAIDVEQSQTKVTVAAHLPPELVNQFVDLWVKRR